MSYPYQISVASMDTWDIPSVLDRYFLWDLQFWLDNIKKHNVNTSTIRTTLFIQTQAVMVALD